MKIIIIPALTSLGIALILTPVIGNIATKLGFVAESNHRTMHTQPIPYLGGLAIYLGVIIGLLSVLFFTPQKLIHINHFIGYFIGGTLIMLTGLYDDLKGTNCYQKLILQIIAAIIVVMFDCRLELFANIFGASTQIKILDSILTVLWIIGIANAFNLIDGLDGLASGISIIGLIALLILALQMWNEMVILLSTVLIGSSFGFLRYNFNPAKIFMGDAGSLFIGFTLAVISIEGFFTASKNIYILIPFFAFGIPIIDTTLAIIRRTRRKIHPFKADKEHIHHRLIDLGFSHRNAVILLYGINFLFGIIAYTISVINMKFIFLIVSFVAVTCFWGIKSLGYFKKSGKKKPMTIINNRVFLLTQKVLESTEVQNE